MSASSNTAGMISTYGTIQVASFEAVREFAEKPHELYTCVDQKLRTASENYIIANTWSGFHLFGISLMQPAMKNDPAYTNTLEFFDFSNNGHLTGAYILRSREELLISNSDTIPLDDILLLDFIPRDSLERYRANYAKFLAKRLDERLTQMGHAFD